MLPDSPQASHRLGWRVVRSRLVLMPSITYLHPLDQPFGTGAPRAADWIRNGLRNPAYTSLRLIVAYAKEGALRRLESDIDNFRTQGRGQIDAVFGFDQRGTSLQALRFALAHFDRTFVWNHPTFGLTFHPKVYIFEGPKDAEILVGSCNLTSGGLESNCESAVRIQFDLPAEQKDWKEATKGWVELSKHPNLLPLDAALLATLEAQGLLFDESDANGGATTATKAARAKAATSVFPQTPHRGASALPQPVRRTGAAAVPSTGGVVPALATATPQAIPSVLLIEIAPHENGEVFLSKRATDQHPSFFGMPWTGRTTPKIAGNPAYPQRIPDPRMDWTVFDQAGAIVHTETALAVNMVLYEKKAEIRITIPPALRAAIDPYSILQMERTGAGAGVDYVCEVHPPGSAQYQLLIASCNQRMPGGGGRSRVFGWI